MIFATTAANSSQIRDITARAGVFNQEEIDSGPAMFEDTTAPQRIETGKPEEG